MSDQRDTTSVIDSETAMNEGQDVHNIRTDVVTPQAEPPAERHIQQPRSGGRIIGLLFTLALLIAIGYGIYARRQHESALATTTEQESVPSVGITHPTLGAKSDELVIPGSVQAFVETPIYSRTNGYLRKWYFDIGSHVRKGQLLAVIETPEVDQQLLQSRAELERQEANSQLAGTTSQRWESLLAKHAVSQQEADQAKSNFIASQAAVDSSKANVRRLEELQAYEHIVAPFDGVITARNTDIGDLIDAGSGSANPRELFHLASMDKMRVYAAVPEVYANRVRDGGSAFITQDSTPGEQFDGNIVRNANSIDRSTRTLNVEVDLDNSKGLLRPGGYVFAHFRMPGAPNTFTIPSSTLLMRAEGPRVAVVQNDRVHLVPVKLGHDYGDTVEVMSGLSANDTIILDPADSLADGAQVRPQDQTKGTR